MNASAVEIGMVCTEEENETLAVLEERGEVRFVEIAP
jgi:hypothetical protein